MGGDHDSTWPQSTTSVCGHGKHGIPQYAKVTDGILQVYGMHIDVSLVV